MILGNTKEKWKGWKYFRVIWSYMEKWAQSTSQVNLVSPNEAILL